MAEGKVASLFVEFRASVNQFASDIRQMMNEVRSFDTTVRSAQKTVSDLGHLSRETVNQFANDLGQLTSGRNLQQLTTNIRQASNEVSNLGHLGSASVAQLSNDLGGLTSGRNLEQLTTNVRQASTEVSNLGHLGSASVNQFANDLGQLTSGRGLQQLTTNIRQASNEVSDLGHLGSTLSSSFNIKQLSTDLRQFERTFYPIARVANQVGVGLSLGLTAPIVAAGAFVIKTGIDFETAFAGVRKTVNASEGELAKLRAELINLSTAAPVTAVEFAQIAQAAGELGIKTPEIARFAQTIAELKATTRLTADEAANFLGRFANITQLDPSKIHNVASTLVALGHGFAANEQEIAAFSLRIARVGSFVGLSQADILGFSAALASLGLTAEAGGSAITRVFADIATAVAGNTPKLTQFASVAGKLPDEFAKLFKTDPSAAVGAYVDGLVKIQKEGGDVFATLKTLNESNIRVRDTVLALAKGNNQLTEGLRVSRNEIEKNGELTRAYGERNKTTASQLLILKNQVDALGISLFDTLAPSLISAIAAMRKLVDEGVKPLVNEFTRLPDSTQHFVESVLVFAAVIGPAILAVTKLIEVVGGLKIILSRSVDLNVFKSIQLAFDGIVAGARTAAGAEGIGALIKALTTPLAVPWWLGPLAYAAVAYEVYNLAEGYRELVDAQISASQTQAGTANAVFENIAKLKKLGFDIDVKGKSIEDLKELTHNIIAARAETEKLGNTVKGLGSIKPPHILTQEEIDAATALTKAHEKLKEKFNEELAPADALNKELDFLRTQFSDSAIIDVYGKRIVDAKEAQNSHGLAVRGATLALYPQAKALENLGDKAKEATEKIKDLIKENQKIVEPVAAPIPGVLPGPLAGPGNPVTVEAFKDFDKSKKEIEDLGKALNDFSFLGVNQEIELFNGQLDKAAKFAKTFHGELPPIVQEFLDQRIAAEEAAKGLKTWEDAADQGGKRITDMAGEIEGASQSVQRLDELGLSDATILDLLGDVIEKAGKNAAILKTDLDPLLDRLVKLREAMKEDTKEAADFGKEMAKLTTKIVNDLANGIAQAIVSGKSLVDVAKKIGQDFAAAFIKIAIDQITAKLVKALASHPVAAAVAAAVIVVIDIVKLLGNSHLFANQFVKEIQNPFGKSLTTLVDGANKLYAVGRQTYQGAQDAETKVQELWNGFLDDATEFGKQGRKQATVAQQAIEALSPTFRKVIFDIQQQIDSLKPPSVRAIEFTTGLAAYRAGIAALTEERIAELNAEAAAINDQIQYTMGLIATQDDMGGSTAELNKQLQDLIYQWDAVQDALHPVIPELFNFAQAVSAISGKLVPDKTEQFLDSVLNATSGAANLQEALGILQQIGTPSAIILDRLGSDIENFYNVLKLSGLPIPDLIEKYHKLANASKTAGNEMPKIANSLSKLVGDAVEKLRSIAGGANLSQAILDALTRLLTGLPAPPPNSIAVAGGIAVPKPVQTQINITIHDDETITNTLVFTDEISRAAVRNSILPEITEALGNNTDSTTEKWIKILNNAWNGVVAK